MKWNMRERKAKKKFSEIEVGDAVYIYYSNIKTIDSGIVRSTDSRLIRTERYDVGWDFGIGNPDDWHKKVSYFSNGGHRILIFATNIKDIRSHRLYKGDKS